MTYPPLATAYLDAASRNNLTDFLRRGSIVMPAGRNVNETTEGTNGDYITKQSNSNRDSRGDCQSRFLDAQCYTIRNCGSNSRTVSS